MSVSVVIPCFDQGRFLTGAIESVLDQTFRPDEVVVVDDGSRDATPEVARSFGSAIRYIRQDNAGLSAARNRGLAQAEGDYVLFLDSDDLLRRTALELLVETAGAIPDAAVIRGSWVEIDEHGAETVSASTPPLGEDAFHALFDPMSVGPPCRSLVLRKSLLEVGEFDTRLRACEDWDLWLRLAFAGARFVDSPDAFAVYRRHASSMSRSHERMWKAGLTVLDRARSLHGCQRCRDAHASGVSTWREYCYLSMLRATIDEALQARKPLDAFTAAARAVRADPLVIGALSRSVMRNVQAAIR